MLLASILALAVHGVGYAQASSACKESKYIGSPWAAPPKNAPGRPSQELSACSQDYQRGLQYCVYADAKKEHCTILLDQPGDEKWQMIGIDCETGRPLSEAKL